MAGLSFVLAGLGLIIAGSGHAVVGALFLFGAAVVILMTAHKSRRHGKV